MRYLFILFILLTTNSFALDCKLEIPKKNYESCTPIPKWIQEQRKSNLKEKEQVYKDLVEENKEEKK